MNIHEHIQNNEKELGDSMISPQRKRHLSSELEQLNHYRESHPEDDRDPNALELYCDSNPDAPECRIFNV
jgi:hypothetical protein